MNRRDFTKMILGTGAAVAAPLPVMTPTVGIQRGAYTWAVAIAHAKSHISSEMIVERLGISTSAARGLISRLAENGVITSPNASGVSALSPSLLRVSSQIITRAPSGGLVARDPLDRVFAQAEDAFDVITSPADDTADQVGGFPPGEEAKEGSNPAQNPADGLNPSDDDPVPQEVSAVAHLTG